MDDQDIHARDLEAELAKSRQLLTEMEALLQRAQKLMLDQQKIAEAILGKKEDGKK